MARIAKTSGTKSEGARSGPPLIQVAFSI